MARVLPSQAVAFIVSAFPWVEDPSKQKTEVSHSQKAHVAALLDLVDAIPDELLVLRDDDYVGFRVVLSEFRVILTEWVRFDRAGAAPTLRGGVVGDGDNLVAYLWRLLRKCPDEVAAPDEHGLEFVLKPDLRMGILVDLGSIQRALSNSEWKAATVLAGSVIEACFWTPSSRWTTRSMHRPSERRMALERSPRQLTFRTGAWLNISPAQGPSI